MASVQELLQLHPELAALMQNQQQSEGDLDPAAIALMQGQPPAQAAAQNPPAPPPPTPPMPQNFASQAQSQYPVMDRQKLMDALEKYGQAGEKAITQQGQGIEELQGNLDKMKQQPQGPDFHALAALGDFYNNGKSDLASQIKAPQTPEERNQMLQALQEKIQGNRNQMSQEELSLMRDKIQGMVKAGMSPLDAAKLEMYKALANNRNANTALRTDTLTNRVVNDVNKDSTLQALNNQKITIDRGIHTMENSQILAPQTLAELESEIAKALAGKGMVAEGSVHRQTMETAARGLAELRQKYGNKPIDMKTVSPEIVGYIKGTMQRLQDAYQGAMNERADQIATGKHFQSTQAQQGLNEAVGSYKKEIGSKLGTTTTDSQGKTWKKVSKGSDTDKNNWEQQ